jgi:hypothetical protein
MHQLLQKQIDKYSSRPPEEKKNSHNFDQDGNFKVQGLFVSYYDEINRWPAPWQSDASCFKMVIPNITVNIEKIPDWEKEITQTAEFEQIKAIYLCGDIKDFSFLSHFSGLQELYVYSYDESGGKHNYPWADWDFLVKLEGLNYLLLASCPNFDTAALRALWKRQEENRTEAKAKGKNLLFVPDLNHLILHTCNISDLSDFAAAKYINDCNLSHNNITDLSPIKDLAFYYLNLRYNKISSLPDLKVDYYLNVRHNEITHIPEWCSQLRRLFVGHNPIEHIPECVLNGDFVYSDLEGFAKSVFE